MLNAVAYALTHGAGLLEAADVVVPFCGEYASNPAHLRAAFLHNEGDYRNIRQTGDRLASPSRSPRPGRRRAVPSADRPRGR
jgi:hypothetical protein